jgi:4-amino-4-deoxy-L-arabinose transferase-like glycosyltransferase
MGRILTSWRGSAALVATAAIVPRLAVLAHERGVILTSFVEKSDTFAQTLVSSGTYGFVPGIPSAYTQPLYGWFLAALYWSIERHWLVVGIAQTMVAAGTALLVLYIGRRFLSRRAGLVAALISTLHPYLAWHDVHVNREILDQLVGAAIFALTLLVAEKASPWPAAGLGVALGLSLLGNSRLAALPLFVAAYLLWSHVGGTAILIALALCVATIAPWVIRNKVDVGCYALTTDAHALWKANNINTYSTLAHGGWIDDVPPLRGAPRLTPEFAGDIYAQTGNKIRIDECAQMRLYRHATIEFWRQHPGEKAKLMQQAVRMLWDPRPTTTETGPSSGGKSRLRTVAETIWAVPVFILALLGLVLGFRSKNVSRGFLWLAVLFLVYETLAAMLFAGATRYRVSWDFVLALLAGLAVDQLLARRESAAR